MGLFLGVYAQIATIIAFCHVALRLYNQAPTNAEQANAVLARRLAEREAALIASHEKLREVERRELLKRGTRATDAGHA